MVGIPRFDTQIAQVSVPTMQNFQQGQNEQIYKAVANVAETTTKIAEKMYENQQMDLAEIEGRKTTAKDSLEKLPTAYTNTQKVYNAAAVASYTTDVHTQGIQTINELAYKYQDDPEKFRSLAYADLNGRTKEAGVYTKKIQKPMIEKIESEYYSMVSKMATKGRNAQKELNDYNVVKRIRALEKKEPGISRNIDAASIVSDIENLVASGDMDANRAIELTGMVGDVSIGEQVSTILETKDPNERMARYTSLVNGQTGIPSLDSLSRKERIRALSKYYEEFNKKVEYEKNAGSEQIQLMTSARLQQELANHPEISAATPKISFSRSNYSNDLARGMISGDISPVSAEAILNDDYANQRISHEEYIANMKSLDESYKANLGNNYIVTSLNAIQDAMTDKVENGSVVEENLEKQYVINTLNEELHKRPYTNEEFSLLKERVIKEAKSIYNDANRYKQRYSRQTFSQSHPEINYVDLESKYRQDTESPPTPLGNWLRPINVDIATDEGLKNRTNIMIDYFQKLGYNNSQAQMMTDHYLKVKKGELNANSRNVGR